MKHTLAELLASWFHEAAPEYIDVIGSRTPHEPNVNAPLRGWDAQDRASCGAPSKVTKYVKAKAEYIPGQNSKGY